MVPAESATAMRMRLETPASADLHAVLGTVPGMIYRTRLLPPYDVDFVSDEMSVITGYAAADFVGPEPKRRLADIVHPDDQERLRDTMVGLPPDGTIGEVEYRIRCADGTQKWILSRARKLVDADGTPWLHGAAIDVTARHEAEELARRLEAERARAAEIEASRARIVEAADEARRRLERDLHDGAQQSLVLAALTLRRAATHARGTDAEPLVSEASSRVQQGLAELRELARGIHPAVLSDHGLPAAIESLAARAPVPVDVRVTSERVAAALEVAIYFTVAEALTNVAKYARARSARVEIELRDGTLVAEVADDGVGGASAAGGSGLRGLADRLDALGGTLHVESPRGGGTTIRAEIPVSPSHVSQEGLARSPT
jgi:PAS domain S-box-containing protein